MGESRSARVFGGGRPAVGAPRRRSTTVSSRQRDVSVGRPFDIHLRWPTQTTIRVATQQVGPAGTVMLAVFANGRGSSDGP